MNELYEFIKKRTSHLPSISYRKLYGLDAIYISDFPFIVISSNDHIVVKIDDFIVRDKLLSNSEVSLWKLDGKPMLNWFVIPSRFNNKKNKLDPIFELTSKVLLHPRKKKKVIRNKSKAKKTTEKTIDKNIAETQKDKSLLIKFVNFFK
jgi:TfoX/Sxy family transcriptional regulator of competence genes